MRPDDLTTKKPRGAARPGSCALPVILTIASHPDPSRIGDRAQLLDLAAGNVASLSRSAPDFTRPGEAWGTPLEDPYLSRRPLRLSVPRPGFVVLDAGETTTPVVADGEVVEGSHPFSPAALDRGVVLELADRVVLLLQRREEPTGSSKDRHGMVGASRGIARVRDSIRRIADLEVPVLLRGESGTGKELAARAIHQSSPRNAGPFVAVNLGAIPPSLAAAELFGSVQGAFTGSVKAQAGYFRAAQGGTLFLDEVGEAPPEVQVMLLRSLESGEIFPVGSQRPLRVDARLIAATDADLEDRVLQGNFKAPLLHRLSAYEVWLPPLRERRDDIPLFVRHFAALELADVGEEHRLTEPAPGGAAWIPAGLMSRLLRYPWPGNVRQLRNVVRQLVIDNRGRPQLATSPRFDRLLDQEARVSNPTRRPSPISRKPMEVGADELAAALRAHRFEPAAAARELGISRPSLYNLVRRHPSLRLAEDLSEEEIREALDRSSGDAVAAALELEVSSRGLRRRLTRLGLA